MLRFALGAIGALIGCILVLPVALGALIFTGFGLLTKFFARRYEPRFFRWDELIEFEPQVGWKPRGNVRSYHLAEDVYSVTTDADGWRGGGNIADSQVVVFGDSFAWGHGIDDENFFANLTGDVKVKPIGSSGYNMVQELLWMRRLAPQLSGKLVVWFIYYGNDLYENLMPSVGGYRAPFVRTTNGDGAWKIESSHLSPKYWSSASRSQAARLDYYAKLAHMCSRTFLSEKAFAACEYLIGEGRVLCRNAGAELVVMTIPDVTQLNKRGSIFLQRRGGDLHSFNPDYPDQQIGEICDRLGIRHLRAKDHLVPEDYKTGDCHWNAGGHRKVAEVLRHLQKQKHPRVAETQLQLPRWVVPLVILFGEGFRLQLPHAL